MSYLASSVDLMLLQGAEPKRNDQFIVDPNRTIVCYRDTQTP